MTQQYIAYTLVDISDTNIFSSKTDNNIGYNQQQNLNTLLQIIGLRSQPVNIIVNKLELQDLVNFTFGKCFLGLHTVWTLEFASEHTNIYHYDDDSTYFLKQDSDGVAFTPNLAETVKFNSNTFETLNADILNLYFKMK